MQSVVAVHSWPTDDARGLLTGHTISDGVRQAWVETSGAEPLVMAVADGAPRSADALEGSREEWAGAVGVEAHGGLWLSPPGGAPRWNPRDLGEVLARLSNEGERRTIFIPVGDEAPGGDAIDAWLGDLPAMRVSLRSLAIEVLVSASRPLLGFKGMSASVRDGREHDAAVALAAQEQERRWTDIARDADALVGSTSLIGGDLLSEQPGAGAAGGLAYVLGALGARMAPAAPTILERWGVARAVADTDVAVSVTADLTPRTLDFGVASAVAAVAGRHAIPSAVLAHRVHVGKRDLMAAGLSSAHEAPAGVEGLTEGVRRVAQTWSPQR